MTAEHHITVPRSARYATLGVPGPRTEQLWIVCHGYGQLAEEFVQLFASLDDGARWLVAPEGLSRYYVDHSTRRIGASWMTAEDRLTEIDDYVRYLDLLAERLFEELGREAELCVLGFSQGAATACRWAVLGSRRVDRLILWGGGVPPDLDLAEHGAALESVRLTLVVGETDEFIDGDLREREVARLREASVGFELVTFAGGHRLDRAVLGELARYDD